jgi:hypothetical protein
MRAKLRGIFEEGCVEMLRATSRTQGAVETIGPGGGIVIRDLSDVAGQDDGLPVFPPNAIGECS